MGILDRLIHYCGDNQSESTMVSKKTLLVIKKQIGDLQCCGNCKGNDKSCEFMTGNKSASLKCKKWNSDKWNSRDRLDDTFHLKTKERL
jgi:hypothetical protein